MIVCKACQNGTEISTILDDNFKVSVDTVYFISNWSYFLLAIIALIVTTKEWIHRLRIKSNLPSPVSSRQTSFVKWDMKQMTSSGHLDSMFPGLPHLNFWIFLSDIYYCAITTALLGHCVRTIGREISHNRWRPVTGVTSLIDYTLQTHRTHPLGFVCEMCYRSSAVSRQLNPCVYSLVQFRSIFFEFFWGN